MNTKFLTTVAAGAIFATASVLAPAAFAQTSAPATTSTPMATAPSTDGAAATTTGSYMTQQSPDQVSANTYIGQSVYNTGNESIGKVSDLIMQKNGGIVAAVVGVGGFLGIGAKNVAVPISNISIAQNQDGTVKLTTSESSDSLKAAPEFQTLAMQSSNSSTPAKTAPADGTTAPAGNTTAPAGNTTAPAGSTTTPADGTTPPTNGSTTTK